MKTIKTVIEALDLPGSTMLPASVTPFTGYLDKGFSGRPVEFCYNTVSTKADTKGAIVSYPNFQTLDYYCLRPFSSNHNSPTDAAMMKVTNKSGRPDTVKRFYEYLLSYDGPWAGAAKCLVGIRPDKHGIPDAYIWYNTAGCCSKLMMNLLTAMRLHTCWGLDYVWDKLVQAGFTNEEAVLLCTNFSWNAQSITGGNPSSAVFSENPTKLGAKLSKLGVSKTDMPFLTNYNASGFAPLFNKKPCYSGKSLKDGQPVQPNSFLWNANTKHVNADNLGSSDKMSNISVSKKVTTFDDYITGKTKVLPKKFVKDCKRKLRNNEDMVV